MANDEIRSELEEAFSAYAEALKNKDVEGFINTAHLPEGFSEEELREDFSEFAEFTLGATPDLNETKFVTVKTLGDDLAGYYCTYTHPDDPKAINIVLTPFKKSDKGWKVLMGGGISGFEPEENEDIDARVAELIENDSAIQLRPPEDGESMGMDFDMDLSAVLNCSAYDHKLVITINGVTLDFQGGSSFSQRLFGISEGIEPSNPGILQLGENRIAVTYQRIQDDSPFPMTVEVMLPPAGYCFSLSTLKADGNVEATFVIPRVPTEEISPEEIECVNIRDE
jgi:hypothetical protein